MNFKDLPWNTDTIYQLVDISNINGTPKDNPEYDEILNTYGYVYYDELNNMVWFLTACTKDMIPMKHHIHTSEIKNVEFDKDFIDVFTKNSIYEFEKSDYTLDELYNVKPKKKTLEIWMGDNIGRFIRALVFDEYGNEEECTSEVTIEKIGEEDNPDFQAWLKLSCEIFSICYGYYEGADTFVLAELNDDLMDEEYNLIIHNFSNLPFTIQYGEDTLDIHEAETVRMMLTWQKN